MGAQEWLNSTQNMNKLEVYHCIKTQFDVEKYLELNMTNHCYLNHNTEYSLLG